MTEVFDVRKQKRRSIGGVHNKVTNNGDSFTLSLASLFNQCSNSSHKNFEIYKLLSTHGFRRRRFYDVINVLETLGICNKINSETLLWNGIGNASMAIDRLARKHGAYDRGKTLSDIIPCISTITITSMTEFFVVAFIALEKQNLDIKEIAAFISRTNGREKTTLCKLYQIAQILQITGIITKTEKKSQFRMCDDFFLRASKNFQNVGYMEIKNLLNRPSFSIDNNIIEIRNIEYKSASPLSCSSSEEI
jgi:hypothetical protein